jgi:hypothetical protein
MDVSGLTAQVTSNIKQKTKFHEHSKGEKFHKAEMKFLTVTIYNRKINHRKSRLIKVKLYFCTQTFKLIKQDLNRGLSYFQGRLIN